jgi:general secretion pathway protein H
MLIVVAIIALATLGVGFALRDSSSVILERDAQRLAALLESARAQSRMSAVPVRWHSTPQGFAFDGLPDANLPTTWLNNDVMAVSQASVLLGPEPILAPQRIRLFMRTQPERSLQVGTDGIRPFAVQADAAPAP